jgi:hypothetical protein
MVEIGRPCRDSDHIYGENRSDFYTDCHTDEPFQALTAVTTKSAVSWDVTPCTPGEIYQVSVELTASIFRVKVQTEQDTNKTQAPNGFA